MMKVGARMETWTISNVKGGAGKSITTAYLAHAAAAAGRRVLVADADAQAQMLRWSDLTNWDIPVVGMQTPKLHVQLPKISQGYDLILIDTPPQGTAPGGGGLGVLYSALRAADVVIVPTAPANSELDRMPEMKDLLEEVSELTDHEQRVVVSLNRAITNARSVKDARKDLGAAKWTVAEAAIPRREWLAQAHGNPITNLGAYAELYAELTGEGAGA